MKTLKVDTGKNPLFFKEVRRKVDAIRVALFSNFSSEAQEVKGRTDNVSACLERRFTLSATHYEPD